MSDASRRGPSSLTPTIPGLPPRYRPLHALGAGGMGQVLLARDEELDRPVALKVMQASFDLSPEHRSRLRREVDLLARVDHPNVIRIYDFLECEGRQVLVLEHLDGSPLDRLVEAGGISIEKTRSWIHDVATALVALHRQGIVHRDVKPENVMILEDRGAVLLDFGLATAIDGPTMTRITKTGHIVGTLSYLPPEMAAGQDVEAPGDVYQLGLVCWECLTGRKALGSPGIVEVCKGRIYDEIPPPSRHAPQAASWDDLVMPCLRRDPALRPSAKAFRAGLGQVDTTRNATAPIDLSGSHARAIRFDPRALESGRRHPLRAEGTDGRKIRPRVLLAGLALVVAGAAGVFLARPAPLRFSGLALDTTPTTARLTWTTSRPVRTAMHVEREGRRLLERRSAASVTRHEVLLNGLEPEGRYTFVVEGPDGERLEHAGSTPAPAVLGEALAFVGAEAFVLDFRTNCDEKLRIEVKRGSSWEGHDVDGGRGPFRMGLPKGSPPISAWRIRRDERILAEGGAPETGLPLSVRSAVEVLDFKRLGFFRNELVAGKDGVFVITAGDMLSALSLRRPGEARLPSGSLIRQRWAFAPVGLGDGERSGRMGGVAVDPSGRVVLFARKGDETGRLHLLRAPLRERVWAAHGAPLSGEVPPWVESPDSDWHAPFDGERRIDLPDGGGLRADREGWWVGDEAHLLVIRTSPPALGFVRWQVEKDDPPRIGWIDLSAILRAAVLDGAAGTEFSEQALLDGNWAIHGESVGDEAGRLCVLEIEPPGSDPVPLHLGVLLRLSTKDEGPKVLGRFTTLGATRCMGWDPVRRRCWTLAHGGIVWAEGRETGFLKWPAPLLRRYAAKDLRGVCAFGAGRLWLLTSRNSISSAMGGPLVGLGAYTDFDLVAWALDTSELTLYEAVLKRQLSELPLRPRELRFLEGGIEGACPYGIFRFDVERERILAQEDNQAFSYIDEEIVGPWRFMSKFGGRVFLTHVQLAEERRLTGRRLRR